MRAPSRWDETASEIEGRPGDDDSEFGLDGGQSSQLTFKPGASSVQLLVHGSRPKKIEAPLAEVTGQSNGEPRSTLRGTSLRQGSDGIRDLRGTTPILPHEALTILTRYPLRCQCRVLSQGLGFSYSDV